MIEASGGGILYDEQTPECLAKVIRETTDMTVESRKRLVGAGREWMAHHTDSNRYANSMERVFREAICAERPDLCGPCA